MSKAVAIKKFSKQKAKGEKRYIPPKMNFSSLGKKNIDGMDVYVINENGSAHKTVFYFHGGGYAHRPSYFHWRYVKKLIKRTDVTVVFPIYPLAPFYTFCEMYDKMLKLYSGYIGTVNELIFMGDSAGGGFSLAFYEYLLEHNLPTPNKVIAISPWVDITTSTPVSKELAKRDPMLVQSTAQVWAELWAGDNQHSYMVSPTYYDKCNKLKNATVITGTDEILYPDTVAFFDKIKDNEGCELIVGQNMNHVYPLYPIPEAKKVMDIIVEKL